jgi:hypothetical protein
MKVNGVGKITKPAFGIYGLKVKGKVPVLFFLTEHHDI